MSNGNPVTLFKRTIGTAVDCDGEPSERIWFYEFIPAPGIDLRPCNTLMLDFDNDTISLDFTGEGNFTDHVHLIHFFSLLPRDP